MNPLTPGQLVDLAGVHLTKWQTDRVCRVLEAIGQPYKLRPDGSVITYHISDHSEPTEPNYGAPPEKEEYGLA